MNKIDYKKQDKKLYFPAKTPEIISIPKMKFVAVKGVGDPNEENGEYQQAMALLYGISYTIKMSKMTDEIPDDYHDFVVPPLEGFWRIDLDEITDFGIADKSKFSWVSMIRLPEFVSEETFDWAKEKLHIKKPDLDLSKAFFLEFEEGLCAQIMHIGPFDDEKPTINKLGEFIVNSGYEEDFDEDNFRLHHEIYLSDFRKTKPENLKTVIRYPIKKSA